jgi:3-oxoacyl-[acyl-carrier-protein] synthase I
VPETVTIVGAGMMTAVGLTAQETTAAVRAGIAMFTETTIHDHVYEPITLAEVVEDALPPLDVSLETIGLTTREIRMVRLAAPALAECLEPLEPLAGSERRPPLILALPDAATMLPLDRDAFLRWLARQTGDLFDPLRSDASYAGRAGGLHAIDRAAAIIRTGRASFAVAGGVDTYRDLYVLSVLDRDQRVKSEEHLDGFIPGEGAAFLLLASAAAAAKAKLTPLGTLGPLAAGTEPGHLYSETPYRGDGLANVVRELLESGAISPPIREVYSSMNGESHWAKEWGVSFIRNRSAFADDHGFHHPADCFGDTGAACGPLLVGLAALGLSAGYRAHPAMVYCSSDRGDRAALAVS